MRIHAPPYPFFNFLFLCFHTEPRRIPRRTVSYTQVVPASIFHGMADRALTCVRPAAYFLPGDRASSFLSSGAILLFEERVCTPHKASESTVCPVAGHSKVFAPSCYVEPFSIIEVALEERRNRVGRMSWCFRLFAIKLRGGNPTQFPPPASSVEHVQV
ncbi:hypothetical protein TB927.1.4970 [Trypanosoma brucei brucei TREU927]|uniref:Uncharacterized protein n=1 Tax=Trypanosoma brucei brucei (strain 927/4 GUTat10.1) TaxID=185431 RepID=Q4GY83_TRYB2|nr:hypothetical protein TB927.1.4970 [Trypanosoma brucei brucei TREU927]CAJ16703.1 hypothetical protein TB927.1.4970 [Trypanosoma brucei brucei TREU927]